MEQISVVVGDDHPVFRSGIESIVRSDARLRLVGSGANGKEVLDLVLQTNPDVLLLDMSMPEMDGVEVSRSLRRDRTKTKILPLSGHAEREYVIGALEAGCSGYLLKDESPATIATAILQVSRGGVFVSKQLVKGAHGNFVKIAQGERLQRDRLIAELGITPRLLEVLIEVAEGLSNEQIADRLFKSPHTVRNQVESLKSIAGVNTRPSLVAWAWRNRFTAPF